MEILLFNSGLFDSEEIMACTGNATFHPVKSWKTLSREISKQDISLVIVHEHQEGLNVALKNNALPPQIPFLVLCPKASVPTWLRVNESPHLVDILHLPIDKHQLSNKISFLYQVHKQGLKLSETKETINNLQDKLNGYQKSIEDHSRYLNLLSDRDGLTGLFNRRYFTKILHREYQRAMEEEEDFSLLLLNIDYFNEINKSSGMEYGDFILNELAARLTQNNRPTDTCFRYSGEEFIILMPTTDLKTAHEVAENLRLICKDKPFNNGQIQKKITVSLGVSSLRANAPADHEELIAMADQALYYAKSEGRDRVMIYRSLSSSPLSPTDKNFVNLKKTLSRVLDKTRSSTINSLRLLAKDAAPEENQSHLKLTKKYVELLCEHLRLPPSIIETFKNAITLHTSIHHLLHADIIKKTESLSKNDRVTIHDFPYKLMEVTQLFDYFSNERTILLYHGEHYDGSGYPEGLSSDAIPLGARMFNLVDSLVAMSSDRPYRPKLHPKEILKELVTSAGAQFDPFLVVKLIDVIEQNSMLDLDEKDLSKARDTLLNKNQS